MATEPPKTLFIALTNPVPGKEAEYNDWYTNMHLSEVVQVEGFVSARRYKLAQDQMAQSPIASQPYKYLAIYELESGAVAAGKGKAIMDSLTSAVPGMIVPPVIDMVNGGGFLVESICDTVFAKP